MRFIIFIGAFCLINNVLSQDFKSFIASFNGEKIPYEFPDDASFSFDGLEEIEITGKLISKEDAIKFLEFEITDNDRLEAIHKITLSNYYILVAKSCYFNNINGRYYSDYYLFTVNKSGKMLSQQVVCSFDVNDDVFNELSSQMIESASIDKSEYDGEEKLLIVTKVFDLTQRKTLTYGEVKTSSSISYIRINENGEVEDVTTYIEE